MRIIINECKKLLDIRIILLLSIFSVLYYMTFTQIYRYPAGGQETMSPHDIPFTAELVKEWGPKWKVKDKKQYQGKHQELEKEFQGSEYGVSDKKYKELKAENFWDGTKLYQKAIEKRVKRDYTSLVHEGVFYILQEDMVTIGSLILICFFALIIPYQVKQRLRQIIPVLATTKIGRRIYQVQLIASMLVALFVEILQMAAYGSCCSFDSNLWSDDVSYGKDLSYAFLHYK